MRCWSFHAAFALTVTVAWLPANALAQATDAAQTITAQNVARHVGVLADDSMLGRDTPSPGLEIAAQYVAGQFKEIGLTPGGDKGTWFQRYPTVVTAKASLVSFTAGGKSAYTSFPRTARLARPVIPEQRVKASAMLVAGRHTAQSLQHAVQQSAMRENIILYIVPDGLDSAGQQQVVDQLVATNASRGVIILGNDGRDVFAAKAVLQQSFSPPPIDRRPTWAVHVRPEVLGPDIFAAAGLNLARVRADTTPVVRELPALEILFSPRTDWLSRSSDDRPTAPNVVGILEGSDPRLKYEYVVISAHMDHTGIRRGRADSISNGADDNASGTAGLIELARAFSQPGMRPRRSLVFLAVSGGAKGFWGSNYVVRRIRHAQEMLNVVGDRRTRVDGVWQVVANLNLDMIGRNVGDSVTVNGLADMELAVGLDWVVGGHPELGLTVTDGGTAIRSQSDHFAFIRLGVPSLYIHNGTHEDPRQVTDLPTSIDAAQTARILRLAFYLGQAIADAEQRPRWSPVGRRRFIEAVTTP
jgi:hypothetical protein